MKNRSPFSYSSLFPIFFLLLSLPSNASHNDGWLEGAEPAVKRVNDRKSLLKTEFGEISAVDFNDGSRFGPYHLQFITLEPNSLFLPVILHSDMVFYVHTGSGRLNWLEDGNLRTVDLRRGVVFRLQPGSIFYLQSSLEAEREKLRIYALFSSTDEDRFDPIIGAYSSITDLVRGFDKKILQESFKVSEEVIGEIMNTTKPPLIVHASAIQSKKPTSMSMPMPWELEARFLKAFMGGAGADEMRLNKKKSKQRVYNIYEEHPDFENCNGRSLTVTKKKYHQLKGSNVGLLFVDLAPGSMMGPHWNPSAWEIGVGVSDEPGMVRVGCSSIGASSKCKNGRFMVGKGDVFVAPKFHPMVQMSFSNGSFVFIGFSTTTRANHPQFMAGRSSVLQKLDRKVLASSFDVNETTIDRLLAAQVESVILECESCAEEEKKIMEEEARKREEERRKKEEEERRKEEEEAKKKEEKERRKKEEEERRKEEEEAKKKEEEERRKEEEEERKKIEEEEERRKIEEEEEAIKREEERRKKEEEERKKREEEEAIRREEEERMKKEEDERKREEEERRKKEEEETKKIEEEEEAAIKREEEERRKKEEEERGREEEEAAAAASKREQEEAERMREEEEVRKREEEGAGKGGREEEAATATAAASKREEEEEAEKMREDTRKGEEKGGREEEEATGSKEVVEEEEEEEVRKPEEIHQKEIRKKTQR